MDAKFDYTFENNFQNKTVAETKVDWVCTNKLAAIADQIGATSFAFSNTDASSEITIGLPLSISDLPEDQRRATLVDLFKGSLEKWIPQINVKETITFI